MRAARVYPGSWIGPVKKLCAAKEERTMKHPECLASGTGHELLLFIIRVKRELKRVYRNGCRYNERLNAETGGSKTPRTHWVCFLNKKQHYVSYILFLFSFPSWWRRNTGRLDKPGAPSNRALARCPLVSPGVRRTVCCYQQCGQDSQMEQGSF
jgi:hypothetical protein